MKAKVKNESVWLCVCARLFGGPMINWLEVITIFFSCCSLKIISETPSPLSSHQMNNPSKMAK